MSTIVQTPEDQMIDVVSPVVVEATGLNGNELLVDLNKVVQEALTKAEGCLDKGKTIIRCDKLPHVVGEEKELGQFCNQLIDIILQHPPQNSKIFIYIKCIRAESKSMQLESITGLPMYEICFHTNSCNEPLWQVPNQEQLLQCAAVCKKYNGSFVSALGTRDYLFKLTLPGKLF
jgi:hypothetical protein